MHLLVAAELMATELSNCTKLKNNKHLEMKKKNKIQNTMMIKNRPINLAEIKYWLRKL